MWYWQICLQLWKYVAQEKPQVFSLTMLRCFWSKTMDLAESWKHWLCSTTGKPTRSFATERVSLDSV